MIRNSVLAAGAAIIAALPMSAPAQTMPSGMLFFYNSGNVCPQGSSRVTDTNGRLLVGTSDLSLMGVVNNAPAITNATAPEHTHTVNFDFSVAKKSIAGADGSNPLGIPGTRNTGNIQTDPSNGNIPYYQILVCQAN